MQYENIYDKYERNHHHVHIIP